MTAPPARPPRSVVIAFGLVAMSVLVVQIVLAGILLLIVRRSRLPATA